MANSKQRERELARARAQRQAQRRSQERIRRRQRWTIVGTVLGTVVVVGAVVWAVVAFNHANSTASAAATTRPTGSASASAAASSAPTPFPPTPSGADPALGSKPTVSLPAGPAPTTLVTKDLIVGTGAEAKAGDTVTVNYVGVLYRGGKEFDSSWASKQAFTMVIGQGQVIKGWDQGIVGMKVGGRRELVIPPDLAYGATGASPLIGPNETLVFVVDLLAVQPPAASGSASPSS